MVAPLLRETAKAHKRTETKEMTVTELELRSLLLKKKREGRHLERAELNWLCRATWRKRRALKREKRLTMIKESAETQENTKQAFQLEFDCEARKTRNSSRKLLPRPPLNSCGPRRSYPIRETSLDGASEKLVGGLCGWNADLNEETGESLEHTEKWERFTGSVHSGCFESIASGMSGKAGEIVVGDVLGHEFSEGMAVLFGGCGCESGGCNVFDPVQADRWLMRDAKRLGLRMAQVTPSTAVRECAVPKTHADAGLFLLLQVAELSREWQREIVVVQLDVKKAFDHVDHRAAFKAMRLQGVSPFSVALMAAIWNGSCMKARL